MPAARLDRELAAGAVPESSAGLAARATALTSTKIRRELAASLQRILAAAGQPQATMRSPAAAARPARIPVNRAQISQSAVPLAGLASCLATPGPVPVQGMAMLSQLLADGTGPLYHDGRLQQTGSQPASLLPVRCARSALLPVRLLAVTVRAATYRMICAVAGPGSAPVQVAGGRTVLLERFSNVFAICGGGAAGGCTCWWLPSSRGRDARLGGLDGVCAVEQRLAA